MNKSCGGVVETCHGTSGSRSCRDVPWHVWELGERVPNQRM